MMTSDEDRPPPAFIDADDSASSSDTDPDPLTADAVAVDSASSSDTDDNSPAGVTVAIPSSIAPPSSAAGVTIALPEPKRHRFDTPSSSPAVEKKPVDDSRRLFQRLWTDEDEIELLQGFLDFTISRGTTSSGHHLDTAAFYDQIKCKLQLDFNKNQLVEKLRRLKKKYRTIISKMDSGKEFVFKSPHDQATFEISKKIWSNIAPNHRNPAEFYDDDQNFGQNPNLSPVIMAAMPTPPPNSSSYFISHINLNTAAAPIDHKPINFDLMIGSNMASSMAAANAAKLSSRKRPRFGKLEDKFGMVDLGGSASASAGASAHANANANANASASASASANTNSNNVSHNYSTPIGNNANVGSTIQGLIEETVRNCLSPMFKDLINNAVNGASVGGGGVRGVGALAMNAIPLNFPGVNLGSSSGEVMDDRWRKQQILELEMYSKRLELVQNQIKLTLEELRSMGGLN